MKRKSTKSSIKNNGTMTAHTSAHTCGRSTNNQLSLMREVALLQDKSNDQNTTRANVRFQRPYVQYQLRYFFTLIGAGLRSGATSGPNFPIFFLHIAPRGANTSSGFGTLKKTQ